MDKKLQTGLLALLTDEIKLGERRVGMAESAGDLNSKALWYGYNQALQVAVREVTNAPDRVTVLQYMEGYIQGAEGRNDFDREDYANYEHIRIHGQVLGFKTARNAVKIL